MSHQREFLGDCPRCGAAIPTANRLIDYERSGNLAAYAECPDCATVVRPT